MSARVFAWRAVALLVLSSACERHEVPSRGVRAARDATAPSAVPSVSSAPSVVVPVPALELGRLELATFADDDLDLPYFLAHLSEVANSVALDGPLRGYIALPVWRNPSAPYNARVMENVLALAWFYTADRPWNRYRAEPALRVRPSPRRRSRIGFRCRRPTGEFSEYGAAVWGLPPTAFATKFMGEVLALLHGPTRRSTQVS